jgi:Flp pilus assembly protein TadG
MRLRMIPAKSTGHNNRKRERGVAVIQLTFLIPILTALFLGTWSMGYSCYIYSELEDAVRSGARYGSLISYDAANTSAFTTAVQNVVVYADPAGGTTPVISGLTTSQVNVTVLPAGAEPTSVTVSITGYKLYTMYMTTFTLTNKPWLTLPYLGHYVPL